MDVHRSSKKLVPHSTSYLSSLHRDNCRVSMIWRSCKWDRLLLHTAAGRTLHEQAPWHDDNDTPTVVGRRHVPLCFFGFLAQGSSKATAPQGGSVRGWGYVAESEAPRSPELHWLSFGWRRKINVRSCLTVYNLKVDIQEWKREEGADWASEVHTPQRLVHLSSAQEQCVPKDRTNWLVSQHVLRLTIITAMLDDVRARGQSTEYLKAFWVALVDLPEKPLKVERYLCTSCRFVLRNISFQKTPTFWSRVRYV